MSLLAGDETRRLVGGVYLTFLLPGVMGLFAQVAPTQPWLWRSTFGLVALLGAWSTLRLIRADSGPGVRGPFRHHRWLVAVLYGVIVVLGVAPEPGRCRRAERPAGARPRRRLPRRARPRSGVGLLTTTPDVRERPLPSPAGD